MVYIPNYEKKESKDRQLYYEICFLLFMRQTGMISRVTPQVGVSFFYSYENSQCWNHSTRRSRKNNAC